MALELVTDVLLPRLLATSVQATLLVAVVWTVCRCLPRLSATARCWLWWLVALQLLLGLCWSNPLALPLLPADPVVSTAPVAANAANVQHFGVPLVSASASAPASSLAMADTTHAPAAPLATMAESTTSALAGTPWTLAVAVLWICGLSVMIVTTLRGYRATRRLLRQSRRCRDRNLLQALGLAADAHGLRTTPQLRVSDAIDSPQLIGPWRPVLLLPADHAQAMSADDLDMALTHELVHLQRGDLWWGLLPSLARHLFFFHPLVHLAVREYGLAREAACDAAVLAGNRHCARQYGHLLLRLGVAPRPSAGLASASADVRILKRRLTMLQDTQRLPRTLAVLIVGAVAALGVMPYRIIAAPTPLAANEATPAASPRSTQVTPMAPSTHPTAAPTARATPAPAAAATSPKTVSVTTASTVTASAVTAARAAAAPRTASEPREPRTGSAAQPTALRGTFTLNRQPGDRAYVLLSDDDSIADSATSELREAQALRRGNESLLWMRKGNARYVVRDPETLARFRAAYAEVSRLGKAQGELGERQGQLGEQQGALGSRQGELGMQQAELAVDAASQRNQAAHAERMAALAARQRSLAQEMEPLAQRQAGLARQQAALAARQKTASEQAQREAWRLMDDAIAGRVAQPIRVD